MRKIHQDRERGGGRERGREIGKREEEEEETEGVCRERPSGPQNERETDQGR